MAFMQPLHHAVIFADPPSQALGDAAKSYFSAFSSLAVETFNDLGFPLDAKKQAPCEAHPLDIWKARFQDWIIKADKKSVLASLPFFDLRTRIGDENLCAELKSACLDMVRHNETFQNVMALNIVKRSPAITAFKNFATEKRGENKGSFDLESKGVMPLVDIVRLYALKEGITETSTLDRLEGLKNLSSPIRAHCQELAYCFQFMSSLCLQAQFEKGRNGSRVGAWIDPDQLNRLEKKALKQIFSFIAKLQVNIRQKHEPTRI